MRRKDRIRRSLFILRVVVIAMLALPSLSARATNATMDSPGMRVMEDLQSVITDLAERVKPSVVNVLPATSVRSGNPRERLPNSPGSGSGVIIDSDGHIITNNHVVGDATEVEIRLSDKTKFTARVIGKDPDTDLALLKITTDRALPYAQLGDSTTVKVGQWVLAVGNPFGLDRTVTLGVVSGIGRENMNLSKYENFIQTDASINPGNSGGPLFNIHSEVIGINTAIINFAQGIGFAIPSNMAKQVMQQLITRGKVIRAWLGVGIQPVTSELAEKFKLTETKGVLVTKVERGSVAMVEGLREGDLIREVNRSEVTSSSEFSTAVSKAKRGETVLLRVLRENRAFYVVLKPAEK